MLVHKQLDQVRVGHRKEGVTLSDVVLLHGERVCWKTPDDRRETWSLWDSPGHRCIRFKNFDFSTDVLLTFT